MPALANALDLADKIEAEILRVNAWIAEAKATLEQCAALLDKVPEAEPALERIRAALKVL